MNRTVARQGDQYSNLIWHLKLIILCTLSWLYHKTIAQVLLNVTFSVSTADPEIFQSGKGVWGEKGELKGWSEKSNLHNIGLVKT